MMAQPNYNLDIQLPLIFVQNKPTTPPSTVPDYRYSYPYYLPPVYRSPEPNMVQPQQQTQVQHQTQAHLPQAYQMPQSMVPTTHQQLQSHLQTQPYSSQMLHPYQNIQPHPQQQQLQQHQSQALQQHNQHQQHQQTNHPVQIQHKEPFKIDYSSLVSYTVSPSLKRKRRKKVDTPTTESNFACNICMKSFQKPYNLKSHMKTHSNDKPFKCPKCFKTFARSHDKKRHELLHDGIKNFKCEGYLKDGKTKWGCGKKFARSDALSRHFRTETGWLCILPLMDEAKKDKDGSVEQEYMDNSNFIKKLIQG